MGWSCSQAAGQTMDRWTKFCTEQTGMQNVFRGEYSGHYYMWEISRVEHPDGRITGTVLRFDSYDPKADSNPARPAGHFCINPDGTVKRAPAILRGLWPAR